MSALHEIEQLLSRMSRAEKAQVLHLLSMKRGAWMCRYL
jgi:hypothetical protein